MAIQSVEINAEKKWEIRVYVCLDVTKSDIVDSSGVSVSQPDRPLRMPLTVAFVGTDQHIDHFKMTESQVWSGSDFC